VEYGGFVFNAVGGSYKHEIAYAGDEQRRAREEQQSNPEADLGPA
jgi:hypothetical protein